MVNAAIGIKLKPMANEAEGDVFWVQPYDTELTDDMLNGRPGPPAKERRHYALRVTDIPAGVAAHVSAKLKQGTGKATVDTSKILANLPDDEDGNKCYIVSGEFLVDLENLNRFKIDRTALHSAFPAFATLINNLYDTTIRHPLVGGNVPSVSWDALGGCFVDKVTDALRSKTEMETEK